MSDVPATTAPESYLDDMSELMDIREDDAGKIIEIREHYIIQIHKMIRAEDIPDNLEIGVKLDKIPYSVGGINKVKNPPIGVDGKVYRFLCVQDGITPIEHPGDMCIRRQTWESFGDFRTPVAGWLAP